MAELTVLVGLPASGKSTYAQAKVSEDSSIVWLSSDTIRQELFGDRRCQDNNSEVFKAMEKRCRVALSQDKSVIYDATNISSKRRTHLLNVIPKGVHTKCVYFANLVQQCIDRDSERIFAVGSEVIKKMYKRLSPPMYFEGWSEITIHSDMSVGYGHDIFENAHSYEEYIRYLLTTPFYNVIEYEQNNPYHNHTLSRHMYKAFEHGLEVITNDLLPLKEDNNVRLTSCYKSIQNIEDMLLIACLLHDIGKPDCCEWNQIKGYHTYYGHDKTSAQKAMWLLHISGYTDEAVVEIGTLIQLHMSLMQSNMNTTKFKNKIGLNRYRLLSLLYDCDTKSHN